MNKPFERIVIVGGGTSGWMAATALAAVLKPPYRIELVESEEIGIIGVGEATIPPIQLFNGMAGLQETEFLRATQGSFKLGIEFVNWGRVGERYFHGFGTVGQQAMWPVEFHHHWLRMRALGKAEELDAYVFCNAAMKAGRFAKNPRDAEQSLLGPLTHAYHFDAGLYARHLRSLSEQRGVRRTEGRIEQVLRHEEPGPLQGRVRALRLRGGQQVEGDFFIDCSGFAALLIGGAMDSPFEDWTHWLPCDRAVAVPSESTGPLLPYTRATAHRAGWQWRIPLQHRVGNGHVYSSRHISDDEAVATLLKHLDGPPLDSPRHLRFTTGMRREAWRGNVLALGLASGFVEPLESTAIHLVQMGIGQLLEHFQHQGLEPLDIHEYNHQHRLRHERVRDFVLLHYHLNQRDDSPFWRDCAAQELPPSLQEKLAHYGASGQIVMRDGEQFREPSWLQVMQGQNLQPRRWAALTELQSEAATEAFLRQMAGGIAQGVQRLPAHGDFLRSYLG